SRARAEAAAAAAKAEAFGQFREAAVLEMALQRLPQVAGAVAQPLSGTRRVTVVAAGGPGTPLGLSRIPAEILELVARLPRDV
ncbi:FLOT1 protein, partial [Neopipo cinnamomea]|nr:FLOT1 protein [Neopipo cinnamomea]